MQHPSNHSAFLSPQVVRRILNHHRSAVLRISSVTKEGRRTWNDSHDGYTLELFSLCLSCHHVRKIAPNPEHMLAPGDFSSPKFWENRLRLGERGGETFRFTSDGFLLIWPEIDNFVFTFLGLCFNIYNIRNLHLNAWWLLKADCPEPSSPDQPLLMVPATLCLHASS